MKTVTSDYQSITAYTQSESKTEPEASKSDYQEPWESRPAAKLLSGLAAIPSSNGVLRNSGDFSKVTPSGGRPVNLRERKSPPTDASRRHGSRFEGAEQRHLGRNGPVGQPEVSARNYRDSEAR